MRILHDANTYAVVTALVAAYAFGDEAWPSDVWPVVLRTARGAASALMASLPTPITTRMKMMGSEADVVDAIAFVCIAQTFLEACFIGIALLLTALRVSGLLERFRIQPTADVSEEEKARTAKLTREAFVDVALLGHWLARPLGLFGIYWFIVRSRCPSIASPVPSLRTVLPQLLGCMLIDDTWFYWGHRLLHTKYFYATLHKRHHLFRTPNVLSTEFAHPIEDFLVNVAGTLSGPLVLRCHPAIVITYACMKLYQSMEAHSGFALPFPFSVTSLIDSMDCAPAHDFHHSHNVGNFGGHFMFWDWLCGTDAHYRRFVTTKRKHAPQYASARRPYEHDEIPLFGRPRRAVPESPVVAVVDGASLSLGVPDSSDTGLHEE